MSISRNPATIRTIVGIAWSALSQVASRPAMRAPRIGRRGASPSQKKRRKGPSPKPGALGQPADPIRRLGEDVAGARGVVVGHQDEAGGGLGSVAGGDDVLGGAAEEQRADQVEAGVEVEVGGDGGEEAPGEADRRLNRGDDAARRHRSPRGSGGRSRTGGGRRKARPGRAGRCARSRAASMFAARRSASVPGPAPRRSRARESARCGQRSPPAADYRVQPTSRGRVIVRSARPEWRNGRRAALKMPCPSGRVGSTPTSGTASRLAPCAGATRSPILIRGCCGSGSG